MWSAVAKNREDLTEYAYRQNRAIVLSMSDACALCGHGGSDTVDHIIPVSRGGDKHDIDNMTPMHGVRGCPVCYRKCNQEKSNKLMSELERVNPIRDWYSG